MAAIGLAACSPPATQAPPTETQAPASTATAAFTDTPEASPTAALLPLEIIEWYEHPIANLADPSSRVTNVEVLIRNPNDSHARIDWENSEVNFLNSAGEIVYTNPSPFFYVWEGEWMAPRQTAALQVCMCLETEGAERPEWETLQLVAPLEPIEPEYTTDVEFTAEFVLLEEVIHGYSGPGVAATLTNTSDLVLESIPSLVFAYDAGGRYVGIATFGNAVASFTEDIGIQPGDTATGFAVSEIDYLGNEPLTYEVQAIGIPAKDAEPVELPSGEPLSEWEGIPIMPGAVGGSASPDAYEFTIAAALEEITLYYETELAALGYQVETSGDPAYTLLTFSSDDASGLVAITSLGALSGVVIFMTQ